VASILTGLLPEAHGVELPRARLRPETPTVAEAFRAAGYATIAYSANAAFVSPRQGFDRGFDAFFMLHGGPPAREDEPDVLPDGTAGGMLKLANAAQVTGAALGWLAAREGDRPYFLYVHYMDPHAGYYPPPEYAKRFGVPLDSPLLTSAQKQYWKGTPDSATLRALEALYDAEVAFTDAEIGRLLDGLPSGRPALIAVTSDHGEEFMEHGGMNHARTLFQEQLHVPLLVAGAGVGAGVVVRQPVSIADVWPTLAELAGLPPPAGIHGRSLAAAARGAGEPAARPLFADLRPAREAQNMLHRHAAIEGSWKLLQDRSRGFALHDLAADPLEKRDLYDPALPVARSLRALLEARATAAPPPLVAPLDEADKERMRALGYDVH
jgi:arylsulfatase